MTTSVPDSHPAPNRRQYLQFAIVLALGAIALALPRFILTRVEVYCVLAWIWPAMFLYAVYLAHSRKQAWIVFAVFTLAMMTRFYMLFTYDPDQPVLSIAVGPLLGLIIAVFSHVPMQLSRLVNKHVNGIIGSLFFPSAYLCFMLIMEALGLHDEFSPATSQFYNPAIRQIASLVGFHGICFIMLWMANCLAMLFSSHLAKRNVIASICCAAVIVTCNIYCICRSSAVPADPVTVRAAMVTGPKVEYIDGEFQPLPVEDNIASLEKAAGTASENGAEILVSCEEAYMFNEPDDQLFLKAASETARKYNIHLFLGIASGSTEAEEAPYRNYCVLIDKTGKPLFEYDKHILVPIAETGYYKTGPGILPKAEIELSGQPTKVTACICYDGNFPRYLLSMEPDSAVLLEPAWDWDAVRDIQTSVFGLRAIEHGTTLIKSTRDGYMFISDPYGRIWCKEDALEIGDETVVVADAPLIPVITVYQRIGKYLDFVYPLLGIIITVIWITRRKAEKRKPAPVT